jgi:hypothetical protein
LARLKALQCRKSGSWLHAIPSPNIGTLLDKTSFQVYIGLRLGCNLCTPHICKCNAKVDEIGIHGLSCSKSNGRFSRHTEINSIINRSLTSIHVNSTLEPNGLSRDDEKGSMTPFRSRFAAAVLPPAVSPLGQFAATVPLLIFF